MTKAVLNFYNFIKFGKYFKISKSKFNFTFLFYHLGLTKTVLLLPLNSKMSMDNWVTPRNRKHLLIKITEDWKINSMNCEAKSTIWNPD